MQRKRHINFKFWKPTESSNSVVMQEQHLHSIPILLNMKNKSNVLYSIPCVKSCACTFCRVVNTLRSNSSSNAYSVQNNNDNTSSNSHSTNVVRWTSPHLKKTLRAGFALRTRSSRIMTPYSRILSWRKLSVFAFLLLSIGFLSILGSIVVGSESCYATTETLGDSSASITLDTSDVEVLVEPGTKGYVSKSITIQASNTKDYALTITAPAILNKENDSTNRANSWGYAYGQSGNLDTMTYTNFTGTTQTLTSGSGNVNDSKTLAITADFTNNPDSGHYKAEINLALTVTPQVATTYSITYNANGDNVSNMPSNQQCIAYDDNSCNITISSTKPTRTNYTFLGWSTSSSATTASYQAGGSISISSNTTLYAVWEQSINHYSLTFAESDGWTYNTYGQKDFYEVFPQQTAESYDDSYVFTIPNSGGYLEDKDSCRKNMSGWSLTNGGAQNYSIGGQITVYASNPHVTLYTFVKSGGISLC